MSMKASFIFLFGIMLACQISAEDQVTKWLNRTTDTEETETRVVSINRLASVDWTRNTDHVVETRDRLAALLQDADPEVRMAAAYAYLAMGGSPEPVEKLLDDSEAEVAIESAKSLLAFTDRIERSVALLVDGCAHGFPPAELAFRCMTPALANRVTSELLTFVENDDREFETSKWLLSQSSTPWFLLFQYAEIDTNHVPHLLKMTESSNHSRAACAAAILANDFLHLPEVRAALVQLLDHSRPEIRLSAASGLLRADPNNATAWKVMRELLSSEDQETPYTAASILGQLSLSCRPVLPELFLGLVRPERQERVCYHEAIQNSGPSIVPELMRFVAEQEAAKTLPDRGWEQIFWILSYFGPDANSAFPEIERKLDGGSYYAIECLCKVGRDDERLLNPCLRVLKHEKVQYRVGLIESLLKTLPTVPTVREPLRLALQQLPKSDPPSVRMDALRLRLQLGEEPDTIVQELITELAHSDGYDEKSYGKAMDLFKELGPAASPVLQGPQLDLWLSIFARHGMIDGAASLEAAIGPDAVPFLIERLKDDRTQIREWACGALGDIGPRASGAVEALTALLDDESPHTEEDDPEQIWQCAASALGKIGPSARSALPKLRTRLDHPQRHSQSYVLNAIGKIGGPADEWTKQHLPPYFDHTSPDLHCFAVIIAIRSAPEQPETKQIVDDYMRRLRHECIRDNGFIGFCRMDIDNLVPVLIEFSEIGRSTIPELQRLFDVRFLDPEARCEVAYALAKLDPQNTQPLEYLQRLSRKRDHDARYDAELALEKLGITKPSQSPDFNQKTK